MTGNYKIFAGVVIGDGSIVEDYCIIGSAAAGEKGRRTRDDDRRGGPSCVPTR